MAPLRFVPSEQQPRKRSSYTKWKIALGYVGSFVAAQQNMTELRDLWWMVISVFAVAAIESDSIVSGSFEAFDVVFDLVSAYSNVGLSMGVASLPDDGPCKCKDVSKLFFMLMMFLGLNDWCLYVSLYISISSLLFSHSPIHLFIPSFIPLIPLLSISVSLYIYLSSTILPSLLPPSSHPLR